MCYESLLKTLHLDCTFHKPTATLQPVWVDQINLIPAFDSIVILKEVIQAYQ